MKKKLKYNKKVTKVIKKSSRKDVENKIKKMVDEEARKTRRKKLENKLCDHVITSVQSSIL